MFVVKVFYLLPNYEQKFFVYSCSSALLCEAWQFIGGVLICLTKHPQWTVVFFLIFIFIFILPSSSSSTPGWAESSGSIMRQRGPAFLLLSLFLRLKKMSKHKYCFLKVFKTSYVDNYLLHALKKAPFIWYSIFFLLAMKTNDVHRCISASLDKHCCCASVQRVKQCGAVRGELIT